MTDESKKRIRQFALVVSAWTLVGIFFFSQGVTQKFFSRDPTPWWHYLVSWLTGVYVWAALTPLVLWLGNRFPIEKGKWLRRFALHLLFAFGIAIFQEVLEAFLLSRVGVFPTLMKGFAGTLIVLMIIGFHQALMTYFTILGIQYGVHYYRQYQERQKEALRLELRSSELQKQLMGAHLSALKMQLQPHFLFNTLNAIMVLVRQQKTREAEQMLARLGDLLRCVLDDVDSQEVPLRRELEYLELYLSIEQVRFQDRLRAEILVDPVLLDAAVPQMGLQPIVENAIRHGIGQRSAAGKVRISVIKKGDTLELSVEDDGPGFPAAVKADGIGLANTRERLRRLYGDAAKLIMERPEQGGARVRITFPYRLLTTDRTDLVEIHALENANR